ncbi:MAG: NAD-dependent epimerase/dehydratase family protein [Sphingomonadales bacterium]|nr:NAD-dependent epimerase/dehydratase family protein [Sphingomonadales bacterium]
MKILVVGGAGFVGSATTLLLHDAGHEVTIMSRNRPAPGSRLDEVAFVAGNYIHDDFSDGRVLEGFEGLVFCAGSDMGNFTPDGGGASEAEFFEKANIEALPRFFAAAKRAGVKRSVYMGSWYSYVAPQVIDHIPYVRSRHLSDAAIRALSGPDFNVCSCALPWIVGHTPGVPVAHWHALTRLAQGRLPGVPDAAPVGGANFMSSRAVAQCMLGGLERGESGKSYLIGDENMSWKAFFELWYAEAGRPIDLPVARGNALVPDYALEYLDFGSSDYHQPDDEVALLGYQRGTLRQTVKDAFAYYAGLPVAV